MHRGVFLWGNHVYKMSIHRRITCLSLPTVSYKTFIQLFYVGKKPFVFRFITHINSHPYTQLCFVKSPLLFVSFPLFPHPLLLLTRVERN